MSTQATAVEVLTEEIERNKKWIKTCLSIKPKEVYVTNVEMWDSKASRHANIPHLLTPVSYNKESIRFKILAHNDPIGHITRWGRRTSTDITYTYEGISLGKFKHVPKEDIPLYFGYKFVDSSIKKYLPQSN